MPDDIAPYGKTRCNIYPEGLITFSQTVLDQVQWHTRQQITISNLRDLPLTLLFRLSDPDAKGFILSYLNRKNVGVSGGKLSCRRIVRTILSPSLALPLRDIPPIYLDVDKKSGIKPFQIALLLAEPTWTDVEFTATSAENFPQRLMGVYQAINSDPEKPLRNRPRESPATATRESENWRAACSPPLPVFSHDPED